MKNESIEHDLHHTERELERDLEREVQGETPPQSGRLARRATDASDWSHFLGRRSALREHAVVIDQGPVPDWCNVGITLRVIVGVNLLCIAGLLLQSGSDMWLDQGLMLAATVEPVLIASLLLGCPLRRLASKAMPALQVGLALMLPALLTWLGQTLLAELFEIGSAEILRHAIMAGLLCGAVLYWAHLRQLAYSPALSEARLQALQSRIRPHFLFNSLTAVLGLIRTQPRVAETALEDLADLFRILMRDSRERVPLREEVVLCKQYLAIEALRLGERLRTEWHVDDSVTHALVPSLLLQPLIENAVHHGIEPALEGGTIRIVISRKGAYVLVVIRNPILNPAGNPSSDQEATQNRLHTGNQIGLDNVRQRLALVHDLEAWIDTAIVEGCFEVKIQFPIQK